ncbi:MAG: ABC transporter ATP-binding protein [Campylobacteraceae bacterium]|jgi:sulfonate transport system ATP-binding protein|nr:ABC transporter ATP-binding protein [Campylobacteraceae bacterium]
MHSEGLLEIKDVTKRYILSSSDVFTVVKNASFDVKTGEFVSIVGPSGCGKSTLLRLIVGLDNDYEGDIILQNERINGTNLARGIVFQDHRLLPWLTLRENISIALLNAKISAKEKNKIVKEHISLVGLEGFESSYPHQLSGGMAQRAAIARALINQPKILLLDEPLGALDAITKMRLQEELQRIWRVEGVSMILVTHDVEEAIFLSNKIIVMNTKPGRITAEIKVDLPEPRDRAGVEFGVVRRKVFEAMNDSALIHEAVDNYYI